MNHDDNTSGEDAAVHDQEHRQNGIQTNELASSSVESAPSIYGESDNLNLGAYAQQAYLEYALSVVKGRALPDVCDGQKPVQRRILYAMQRLGLGFGGSNGANGAKPVKSARVVGDVLGRYHPHSDQAAYDAMVRMAQNFALRYPLVDGQGNFGSRDGDGAAAMRYTEARLSKISTLLMDEIDEGTVEFVPNYDGSTEEPRQLPARLPFVLLNGASGIAVGMATEIPSHNLREVAAAAVALIKNEGLADGELLDIIPAPDFPGGGQIISSGKDIADIYATGRGSLKVRARWTVEELARGQWQLVVHELPPATSTQKVLEEIEELTNPKIKSGKKALTAEQLQLKASVLAVLDTARDESNKDAAVRLVLEPKSSRVPVAEFIGALLAHTSLESSVPVNLTMVGLDGKPVQKNLRQMLTEWIAFRQQTVRLRSQHRLEKILARIHILEGRQIVLLNIDEVIRIIRESDEPKPALIAHFRLSERQAEDILEIRLRQLARLEAIKIEQELAALREEQAKLEEILGSPAALRRLMVKEIEADAKQFGDARRTLVQEEKRTVAEIKVVDEALTVIVSSKGWVRTQKGHGLDASGFVFKSGDALYGSFECRSVDTLLAFGSKGRVYSVAVAQLPGGRGDGQPINTLIELESGTQLLHFYAGALSDTLLLAGSSGYGFMAKVEHMVSRQKAGKAFVTLDAGEGLCLPSTVPTALDATAVTNDLRVCCVTKCGRLLSYPLSELRVLQGGGRGLMLMALEEADSLVATAVYTVGQRLRLTGLSRTGKPKEEILEPRILEAALHKRAKKGKTTNWGFSPIALALAAPKPAKVVSVEGLV